MQDGRYTVNSQMTRYTSIPIPCHHLFGICAKPPGKPADRTGTTVKSRRIIELKECFFTADCIDYLAHEIPPERLGISTKSADANLGFQHPINVTELKSLLSLCKVF